VNPIILLVLAAGALMILGAGIALIAGGGRTEVDERLQQYVTNPTADATVIVETPKSREFAVADRVDKVIAGRGFSDSIKSRIAKADAKLRVSEYIAVQVFSIVGFGALGYFIFNESLVLAVLGGILGFFIPQFYLSNAAKRRLRAFENQLVTTLNLWVNAIRSGYSVLQAMEAIATELQAPVSIEFERVVQEVRLGLTVPQALENMLRRVPSDDLDLVVTAVKIQREVGGNLAEILDTISFTIRERIRIKGEIRTLTAQGRLSGWIISLLPFVLAFMLYLINRPYVAQLWVREEPFFPILNVPCGWIVIGIGGVMMIIGIIIIQKIVDIEV
jgi:tight adherence protein B